MSLRPFAPLAVIGAGLLMMSLATHSASAEDAGAPSAVGVASSNGALVVTWTAPDDADGLQEYDLLAVDPASGRPVLESTVPAGTTQATIGLADLGALRELSISVTSSYDDGAHAPAPSVRVLLPQGPTKPDAAPAVRVEGRRLQVALPDAPDGVSGRVVQLYRDGDAWTTVSVASGKAVVTREVAAGHRYRAAYQDVEAGAPGPQSDRSAAVKATDQAGPAAVRRIKVAATDAGLRVHWSAAAPQGAELVQYRVTVRKDGAWVGRATTAGDVRSAVLSGAGSDGHLVVTVVAEDAAGGISSSTAAVATGR